jgi:uncharacterized protein
MVDQAIEPGVGAVSQPQPVSESQRLISVDALRGVALLGILVMNVPWFAFHSYAFFNPALGGGFTGANFGVWLGCHLLFDAKMMALFSMLFGAGLILLTGRVEGRGVSAAGIYYRRIAWLLVIGLLHAYLLWMGDILVSYALCGLILYPMRRWRPAILIAIGSALLLIGVALNMGQGHFFAYARSEAAAATAAKDAGETPTAMQSQMLEAWKGMSAEFQPTEKKLEEERATYQAGYLGYLASNAPKALMMQTMFFFLWALWRATGLMLIGMGLMRLGVFSAQRSKAFYIKLALAGYGIGLPLVGFGAYRMMQNNFDFVELFKYDWNFNYIGSILVALGHAAVVMLIVRSGALKSAVHAVAAVGRMALTNYLMQTLLLGLFFLGWGAGMWGRLDRVGTIGVVLAIWSLQLVFSPLWLSRFRFGPVEWVWRSLTYWKPQPMRKAA